MEAHSAIVVLALGLWRLRAYRDGAVQGDRYEVIEQNFLDFNPNLEGHWATFDLRSVGWPDPAVVGFVVAPPAG